MIGFPTRLFFLDEYLQNGLYGNGSYKKQYIYIIHIYIRTYIHRYTYIHIYKYTYIHIYTYTCLLYVFKTSQKMTFPPSLHPNSFSFPSFNLNIFFLQCKQSSSLFLSVESAISKRLEGLKFVNFLGAVPLDPSLGCDVSPSCFTRSLHALTNSTSCYPCSHMYLGPHHSHHSLRP